METPRRMSLFYTCLSSSRCLPSNPGALTDRVALLGDNGPNLKRPVVGEISSSRHQHMKELRVAPNVSHEGSDVDRLASGHLSSGGWNLGFGLDG